MSISIVESVHHPKGNLTMSPYPRISSFDIDPVRFSAMIEEFNNFHGENEMDDMEKMLENDDWMMDPTAVDWDDDEDWDDDMDGDWDSGMESAGWGTDEDYGYYGEDF